MYQEDETFTTNYIYEFSSENTPCIIDAQDEQVYGHTKGRIMAHSAKHNNVKPFVKVIKGIPRLLLMACKDIEIADELTFDYGVRSRHGPNKWLDECSRTCCRKDDVDYGSSSTSDDDSKVIHRSPSHIYPGDISEINMEDVGETEPTTNTARCKTVGKKRLKKHKNEDKMDV